MFFDKLTVILSCEEPQSRYLGVSTAPDKTDKSYFGRSFHWTVCTCGCPFNTRVEKNVKHFRRRPQYFSKRRFFLRNSLPCTRKRRFQSTNNAGWNAPQKGGFENAGFSFRCGRTKTEVFEYDDVIHHIPIALHKLCSIRDVIILSSYKRFRVDGQKRFKYVTCGRVFFENGEKK